MIGFEHKHVRGADAFEHQFGHVAQVGDKADVAARRAQNKSDRVLRIVRDGKRFDLHVSDLKSGSGGEKLPVDFGFEGVGGFKGEVGLLAPFVFERPNRGVLRLAIAEDGNLKFIGDAEQAANVVGMFVRDENGGEIFRRAANGRETLADLARGKAGVNEHAGIFGFEIGAIAG